MKRTINFLATLMFAFLVSFGLVVNNASAATYTCQLKIATPCDQLLRAGDVLNVGFGNITDLDVTYQSKAFSLPVLVNPTIGASPFPAINLAPRQILNTGYPTTGQTGAVFVNATTVTGGDVLINLEVSQGIYR